MQDLKNVSQKLDVVCDKLNKLMQTMSKSGGVDINLPDHLFIPEGAESLDQSRVVNVLRNTTVEQTIISIIADESETIVITHYALYTDVELAKDIEFWVKKNGGKQLQHHGTPNDPINPTHNKLTLSIAPDLKNDSLKNCQIQLLPKDKLTVSLVNCLVDLDVPMGIRIVGYILPANSKTSRHSW